MLERVEEVCCIINVKVHLEICMIVVICCFLRVILCFSGCLCCKILLRRPTAQRSSGSMATLSSQVLWVLPRKYQIAMSYSKLLLSICLSLPLSSYVQ